jgi:hypothetical protein
MIRILSICVFAMLPALSAHAEALLEFPRAADGHPDLSGVWQTLNTAHWNLEPHVSDYSVVPALGAQFAVPPGQGVVEGGKLPYLPEALVQRDKNFAARMLDDPEGKCYLGGVPRSTYMPYPFQIFQNTNEIVMIYQFATGFRRLAVNGTDEAPLDSWMGWSNAHWEGDSLVVEVTGLNGLTWLDRAGNYTSAAARITERYTPMSPNHVQYEATIDDPAVFSQPWSINMPLYRIVDDNYRMLEFKCELFAEEKLYGHLRKPAAP